MENKEKNFVSAVIYVHNAERRIEEFLKVIVKMLEANFEHSEIICVNDGSTDHSLEIIRKVSRIGSSTSISVVNLSYFHGLEVAMNAGMDLSIGDFVYEFDNTVLDFDEQEILNVYRRSLQGYDIVSAVPDRKERYTSKIFYRMFERFSELPYQMHTESFRILSRRVINRIGSMTKTTPYRKAIYASQGLRTDAIIYKSIDKTYVNGEEKDKQESRYRSRLAVDSLILFTELGYDFSVGMTVLMMAVSILMTIYSIVIFAAANPVAGWTTTVLFLSVAFFGLFAILSIVIKYLQLLVNLVFKRKQYSVEGIEKLTN